jgi:hypothetical protein
MIFLWTLYSALTGLVMVGAAFWLAVKLVNLVKEK